MATESVTSLVQDPYSVFAILLGVLSFLFWLSSHPTFGKFFRFVPLIVFCYFVPTLLSNFGIIPMESAAYSFIKKWLLPCSLVLLTLTVDIPAIMKLGKPALILFFTGTISVMIGGPIAYMALGGFIPDEMHPQVWRGLSALAGSWIGGGANFIAVGQSVGAESSTMGFMAIVDVAVANAWMACLLYFAAKEKQMDSKIGADRTEIEELKKKVETFQKKVARPTHFNDLLLILTICFGVSVIGHQLSQILPEVGVIISKFTWVVLIVSTVGVLLSFTPARKLDGTGAGAVGSLFLFLLVATIGAQAEFKKVIEVPALVAIGALWMMIHATFMWMVRRKIKAPIFFMAVGSQANIGAAASAPVVAAAFHPSLSTVGLLLAILGYVLGNYCALICAYVFEKIYLGFFV